jgi:hypothetical protein
VVFGDDLVAGAKKAQGFAKWNVHVDGQRLRGRNGTALL